MPGSDRPRRSTAHGGMNLELPASPRSATDGWSTDTLDPFAEIGELRRRFDRLFDELGGHAQGA